MTSFQPCFGLYLLLILICLTGWTLHRLFTLGVKAVSQHLSLSCCRTAPYRSPLAPSTSHLKHQSCPLCLLAKSSKCHTGKCLSISTLETVILVAGTQNSKNLKFLSFVGEIWVLLAVLSMILGKGMDNLVDATLDS